MYTIVQFSPTGNAKHLAFKLAEELKGDKTLFALEHVQPAQLKEADHLILIYAIHAFNAPRTVMRFVKTLPPGLFKHVSILGVGCNTSWINDAMSKDVKKILEKKNYSIVVDEVLAMPLTFIMSFPENVVVEQLDEAHKKIITVATDIHNLKISERQIPIKSHVLNFVGKAEHSASRMFGLELHAKKSCTKCALCIKECPEKNIRFSNSKTVKFGFKCLMCMRCIYNCPEQAITPRISKFIPIKKGYSLKTSTE